jgi:hypothetical protein
MSGTSLSNAIAQENGATNAVSSHTPAGISMSPVNASEKCAATPRFTTSARTPLMQSAASAGQRLSRTGGTE